MARGALYERTDRAVSNGHREWILLPAGFMEARLKGKDRYYTGHDLFGCKHSVGPQLMDGSCAQCADVLVRAEEERRIRILEPFAVCADRMIETGRAHVLVGRWDRAKVQDAGTPTNLSEAAIRDGWQRAGERALKEGRLFIAKASGRRMKVVEAVRKWRL